MKKYSIPIVLFCALSMMLTSCIWQPPERNSILAGRKMEEDGQYLRAQAYYRKMENPSVRDVSLHNLQHLYGDIIAAMQARQEHPNSPEAYYELGRAYYEKMLLIPDADPEIAPNISNFDTSDYFARQRQQLQANAQPALETATQLRAQYPDALALKAKVYEESDSPEKAIPIYQEIIASQQATAEVYYRLAALFHNRGDVEQALEYAREGTTQFSDDPDAYFVLGKLYAIEDMREEAVEAFQHSLCLDPFDPETYYRLAQVYLTDSNPVDAERVLRLGVVKNPEANKINLLFSSLEEVLDEKQMDEFMEIYESAVSDIVNIMATYALTGKDVEPDPLIEIRYFQLLIRYLERQRPYTLPCSGEEEHPYFDHQIRIFQEKIAHNEKILADFQKESETVSEESETVPEEPETAPGE